jgi:hypothetical protein
MKELNDQEMTLEKFQAMNVLAQRSFAAAIGLSSDELANQLRLQKLAVESGKSLVQVTEEEALEAQKRQTIQDKFNAGIDKLKDIVGNLLTGPVSQLLDAITNVVYLVGLIGKPFAYVNDLIEFVQRKDLITLERGKTKLKYNKDGKEHFAELLTIGDQTFLFKETFIKKLTNKIPAHFSSKFTSLYLV